MSQILVVSQQLDLHADLVVKTLTERGEPVIRINTDEIPQSVELRASLGAADGWDGGLDIAANGLRVELDNIRSVWWRRPAGYALPADMPLRARLFTTQEWDEALRGLLGAAPCYWMSHPDLLTRAEHKPEQLARAQRLGFEVPGTLLTDDADAARKFFEEHDGRVVFKVLSDTLLGGRRMAGLLPEGPELESLEPVATPTTALTREHLDQLDEGLALAPGLFQERVRKRADLRVTIVGDTVFCTEMASVAGGDDPAIWRGGLDGIEAGAYELPADVAERCLALVRGYGLNYSAIDLLHTPDDRYVFLESNPNGQFLFVEDLAPEFRVVDTVADHLQRGGST